MRCRDEGLKPSEKRFDKKREEEDKKSVYKPRWAD
jgi:hypothetical protein